MCSVSPRKFIVLYLGRHIIFLIMFTIKFANAAAKMIINEYLSRAFAVLSSTFENALQISSPNAIAMKTKITFANTVDVKLSISACLSA